MRNKGFLVSLVALIGFGGTHVAQAQQLLMPTLDAHGSTLALLLCGMIALIKARRDSSA